MKNNFDKLERKQIYAKFFKSGFSFILTFGLLALTAFAEAPCELPAQYKGPFKTFVINEKLSCATNIFLNAIPFIAAEAGKKLTEEEKKNNPQTEGRIAYELFGDAFAKNKPNVPVTDFTLKGKDGKHDIPVRLYKGKDTGKAILFTHGGGWTRGNLKTHDTLCRKLCEATGATVLAVDYRLAPENPHPAGLDDAQDAYEWLIAHPENGSKIYVSGDSGGGNIATSLMVRLIKENKRIPEKTTDPYANGYLLTRESINGYVHNYIGNNPQKAIDSTVSPLLATDDELKQFPPLILVNAECDPLAAEGKAFEERLKSLNVSVVHKIVPKTIHIFAQYFDLFPEATDAIDFIKTSFENLGVSKP